MTTRPRRSLDDELNEIIETPLALAMLQRADAAVALYDQAAVHGRVCVVACEGGQLHIEPIDLGTGRAAIEAGQRAIDIAQLAGSLLYSPKSLSGAGWWRRLRLRFLFWLLDRLKTDRPAA